MELNNPHWFLCTDFAFQEDMEDEVVGEVSFDYSEIHLEKYYANTEQMFAKSKFKGQYNYLVAMLSML